MDVKSDTAKIRYQVKEFSFVWMRRCNPLGSVNSLLSQASLLSGANPVSLFTLLLVFTPPAPQQSPWRGGVQVAYSSLGSLHSYFSSVQFRGSVVSDSLLPHGLQHARPPCPSPTSRVYSNSCPSSRWCHLITCRDAISSSVVPFSCPQSFPASGSLQMSQFLASGGQRIGVFQLQHQSFQWTPRTDFL